VLHYINDDPVEIKNLYDRVNKINEGITDNKFAIPFIKNFNGESPLHLCLKNQNMQSVNTFLLCIKDDPLDNHARDIIDIIPEILSEEIPSFKEYLSARVLQTSILKSIDKGSLQINYSDHDYQLYTSEQWVDD
jgi:hypothetical protein